VELLQEAPEEPTWEAAITLFVEGWAADHPGIRQTTLGHYREQLANRIAAFAQRRGIHSAQDLTRQDLRAFVVWLDSFVTKNGKSLTPRGKQMALATAKQFLGWLYRERLISEDIGTHVATYRLDTDPEPRATPSDDLQRVLSSLNLNRPCGVRNMAMIHLMAFCGLRVAELVGLNASDLDLAEGRVRVKAATSKVRRARHVDLPLTISGGREVVKPEVAELMAKWLRLRSRACPQLGEGDALFVTLGPNQFAFGANGTAADARPPGERLTTDAVRTIMKRLAAKAGVDPHLVAPHRLRHYFGVTSPMAGVPTTALMRALGHRTPLMTARYSEFADAERRWAFARADITNGIRLPGASPTARASSSASPGEYPSSV
jgi:integrase/recombinase XerD